MRDRSLFWALAAAAGILYLATRAAERQPAPGAGPTQPNVSDGATSSLTELPLEAEAPPVATFPSSSLVALMPATLESRTGQYNRDFIAAVTALEGQTESGRVLEIDGPVL